MKENIIIRLERENEYHEVENLVRESFWNVYRPGCLEHYVLHQLRNDPAFVPELDFVMGEDTNRQVDFLIKQLHLKETKKYLILHVDLVGTHWSLPDVGMMLPVLILHRRT